MLSLLFVEDEISLHDLIGDALACNGIAVTPALDGRAALELLAADRFDVVISDVTMPGGFSGIELAQHIIQHFPDTRVILVSGHARAQLPPIPAAAEFLPKPYRIGQLLALLAEKPAHIPVPALPRQ
jgi:two-component system, cell cycle response regulator CpdR